MNLKIVVQSVLTLIILGLGIWVWGGQEVAINEKVLVSIVAIYVLYKILKD